MTLIIDDPVTERTHDQEQAIAEWAEIEVRHDPAPGPSDAFDYQATRPADYDLGSPTGFGSTPEAAIADLIEQEEERKG